jgi:spermidine synthase
MTEWFAETLHSHVSQHLSMERVLYRERTEHQDLVIFENGTYGRVLALDGVVQTTTADEFVYHEMIVHVPMTAHGAAKRVLIVGGGDGGTLRRALMHPVERAVLVELDRSVVDLSKEYLSDICGEAFEDPRSEVVIADGCRFVKETDELFDVVVIDSTDPFGPGAVLFTDEFFADCRRRLAPGGVFVNQGGVPWVQGAELAEFFPRLKGLYRDATVYLAPVPIYIGGHMAFGWASDDPSLRGRPVADLARRFAETGIAARYYTPEVHAAAFALPGYVAETLAG